MKYSELIAEVARLKNVDARLLYSGILSVEKPYCKIEKRGGNYEVFKTGSGPKVQDMDFLDNLRKN